MFGSPVDQSIEGLLLEQWTDFIVVVIYIYTRYMQNSWFLIRWSLVYSGEIIQRYEGTIRLVFCAQSLKSSIGSGPSTLAVKFASRP